MTNREDAIADLIAAATRARDILRQVGLKRRQIGPIATHAQTVALQLSVALAAYGEKGRSDD